MSIESVIDAEYTDAVDARLSSYDAYIEYQAREAKRAIPFLACFFRTQGARVLEIGTGRGGKGIAYACEGMNVTALDVDVPSLELGAQAARTRGASIRFLVGDGTRLPFPADYFDAVLLDSVIEHVRDTHMLLLECSRVLKKSGIVFVVFPPFFGPLSGHIDDYVMIPWFHLLPRAIVKKALLAKRPRQGILTPLGAYDVYTTLNGLTVHSFKRYARGAGFETSYLRVRPFLTHPGMRLGVGLVTAMRRAPHWANLRQTLARARREFDAGSFFAFLVLAGVTPLVFVPLLQEVAAGGCKAVLRKP
ncbi:MAG: class I SAM-dependent methyltransferase [Chloroflexi bacterium]|nr:class I SAM-dependent methyltransferase [Chloroflexota bacterium]